MNKIQTDSVTLMMWYTKKQTCFTGHCQGSSYTI